KPAGAWRRSRRSPRPAERDVRPPLARRGHALDRAGDPPARDEDPQVVAERRHELLDDGASRAEPRALVKLLDVLGELVAVGAQGDVEPPAPERRLHDERRLEVEAQRAVADPGRPRVRDARLRWHLG